jgi:hypothetical protein
LDPEILPEAGDTIARANTPERDVAEASLAFTLPEEGGGDNTTGNKELRNEGEHEDENNSRKPKVPLHPPPKNERTPTTSYHQQTHRTQTNGGP